MKDQKPTEAELKAWLETVHFGSCCSDPADQPSSLEQTGLDKSEKENRTNNNSKS